MAISKAGPKFDPDRTRREENTREHHRPDWLAIFLGVTCTFALLGASAIIVKALRLDDFSRHASIAFIVFQLLWIIGSVVAATYFGAYFTGLLLDERNRIIAALDGLAVWQITVLLFALVGWFGYEPLPAITLSQATPENSEEAFIWMTMMLGIPVSFVAAYGAMAGNAHVRRKRSALREREERERKATRKAA